MVEAQNKVTSDLRSHFLKSTEEVVERIWSGVTERTRVLFVGHITSPTALILPVAELIQRARAAGILTIVTAQVSPFVLQNEWQGTRDIAAYLSVPAAIQFQPDHDWPSVRVRCHELLRELRDVPFLKPTCPDSAEWTMQMATFELPACDAGEPKRRLYDEYRVEVPIIEWGGRQLVRASVQGYNTREDVGALGDALAALLPQVSH